ncbi:MAG TPA: SBBP repeat-containing protein, partial [Terriglobales bacterium]
MKFLARGGGYGLYLTSNEAVLALASRKHGSDRPQPSFVRMQFAGAASNAAPTAAESLPGRTNYILGNDSSRWLHNIPQFARVQYHDLYPGIGLDFYGNQGRLEYDFNVAPGADPRQIELKFEGADNLRIDAKGNLVLASADREVQFEAPRAYQKTATGTQGVEGAFVLRSDNRVGFEIGNYDRSRTLVIDPVLTYSTYLGGSGAESCAAIAGAPFVPNCPAITVDSASRVYIAGATTSTSGWPAPATGGATTIPPAGGADVFVARISNSGSALTLDYLTFIGGSSTDYPTGIAVDTGFDVYVAGNTSSSDFPTVNGLQSAAS